MACIDTFLWGCSSQGKSWLVLFSENLVRHKFLEIEVEHPGEKTPPYATPPQSQPIPVQSNFDRSSPKVSPGQSPGSSPSRWGSRSPSNSSTKLALMQKMRRSPREPMTPRNPILTESTKSSAGKISYFQNHPQCRSLGILKPLC